MTRYRMNKILKLLENNELSTDAIRDPKNRKALLALESAGCIQLIKAFGGEIVTVHLLDAYAGYQLNRHDIWLNRLWGFIAGVAVTLVADYLIGVLGL